MQILTNWENFTDEELRQLRNSLNDELRERIERKKDKAIQNFLHAFIELEKLNISVYFDGDCPIRKNDLSFE